MKKKKYIEKVDEKTSNVVNATGGHLKIARLYGNQRVMTPPESESFK